MSQQRKIDFDKIRLQFENDSDKILRHYKVTNDDTALLKPSVPQKPLNIVKRAPSMMTLPRGRKFDHGTIRLRPIVPPKPIKNSFVTPTTLSPVSPGADSLYEPMYETISSVNEFKIERLVQEKPGVNIVHKSATKISPAQPKTFTKPVTAPKPGTPTKPVTSPGFDISMKPISSQKPITSSKPITSPKPISSPKPIKPLKPPINNENKISALKSSLRLDLPNSAKTGSLESALSGSR